MPVLHWMMGFGILACMISGKSFLSLSYCDNVDLSVLFYSYNNSHGWISRSFCRDITALLILVRWVNTSLVRYPIHLRVIFDVRIYITMSAIKYECNSLRCTWFEIPLGNRNLDMSHPLLPVVVIAVVVCVLDGVSGSDLWIKLTVLETGV